MKRFFYILAVAGVVVVAALLWRALASSGQKTPQFRMGVVDRGPVEVVVTATGTVSAVTTVQVGSQVSGTIKEIYVDFNSPVRKGQIIARLDPTFLEAAVAESEANLERAKASLAQAERDLERVADLFRQNLTPKVEYDNALTAVDLARASVRQAEAQVKRARVNLAYSVIQSPIDGVVISRNVDVGQTVAASLQAPTLFTIAQDLREMQVETNIDEADIGGLHEDMEATFTVDSYPDEVFHGVIRQVRYAARQEQSVVTYPVILRVENPELKLRPGMTANVSVVTARRENVKRVPATALRFRPPENVLARDDNGAVPSRRNQGNDALRSARTKRTAEQRAENEKRSAVLYLKNRKGLLVPKPVQVGLNDGTYVELLSPEPAEGDSVVVGLAGLSAAGVKTMPGMGGGIRPR